MNDSIADFLIRIKNACLAKKRKVSAPYSKFKEELAKILKTERFLEKIEVEGDQSKKQLILTLPEKEGKVSLLEVERISKSGRRVYIKSKNIRSFSRGLGIVIISTPSGLMTAKEAVKKNLGGEIICKIT